MIRTHTSKLSKVLLIAVLALPFLTAGCRGARWFMYVLMPWTGEKSVAAEFTGLKNHSVAVVIYADEGTQYQYPYVQLNLGALIANELVNKVKGVTTTDPLNVISYQRQNVRWDEMDRTAIGKALGAQYVLCVTLVEFATVEKGYLDLIRGRITAEASLYKVDLPERKACLWREKDIRVVFPDRPTARIGNNEEIFRLAAMRRFVRILVRNFYAHKVEEKP